MTQHLKLSAGYTLIELMVSIAVFAIVMTLVTGAYIQVIGASAQAQATITATDNLAFVLDSITRLIRTGDSYRCGTGAAPLDCTSTDAFDTFTFRDVDNRTVTFQKSGDSIVELVTPAGGGAQVSYPLTDASLKITSFTFTVKGSDPCDAPPLSPTVRILVSGTVPGVKGSVLPFTFETFAAMRGVDSCPI